jgi:hypothetical protein
MPEKPSPKTDEPELRPDGWERFEKAVDAALHTKPQRHETAKPESKRRSRSS